MFNTTIMHVAFMDGVSSSSSSSSSPGTSETLTTPPPPSSSLSSPVPTSSPEQRKRHCWECLRRRLVCDSTTPVCKRCHQSGVVCPGYEDQKPLKWLAPGKVTPYATSSRPRKKKGGAGGGHGGNPAGAKKNGDLVVGTSQSLVRSANNRKGGQEGNKKKPDPLPVISFFPPAAIGEFEPFQKDLSHVLQAAGYYNSHVVPEYTPVTRLFPKSIQIEIFLDDVVQMPRPSQHNMVCLVLAHRIHQLSAASYSSTSSSSSPSPASPNLVARLWSSFFHHRGLAIRGLTEDIVGDVASDEERLVALSSIVTILHVEVQQSYPNWRLHYEGAIDLMSSCAGGLELMVSHPIWKGVATVSLTFNVFGNSTSPSGDQSHKPPYEELIPLITDHFDTNYCPTTAFPMQLLLDVAHVNRIRFLRSLGREGKEEEEEEEERETMKPPPHPHEILSDILSFYPEEWPPTIGSCSDSAPELVTYGEILQSAVLLYCVIALDMCRSPSSSSSPPSSSTSPQSSSPFFYSPSEILRLRSHHRNRLLGLIRSFSSSSSSSSSSPGGGGGIPGDKILMWPLAVAGCALGVVGVGEEEEKKEEEEDADRKFLLDLLPRISGIIGQATPLMLRRVLVRFWSSSKEKGSEKRGEKKNAWDDCFDEGYYFAT